MHRAVATAEAEEAVASSVLCGARQKYSKMFQLPKDFRLPDPFCLLCFIILATALMHVICNEKGKNLASFQTVIVNRENIFVNKFERSVFRGNIRTTHVIFIYFGKFYNGSITTVDIVIIIKLLRIQNKKLVNMLPKIGY
jgi:hypothetical protein